MEQPISFEIDYIKSALDESDYFDIDDGEDYYHPPMNLKSLCRLKRANPQHGRMPKFRTDSALLYFIDNSIIDYHDLREAQIDMNTMGTGYLQLQRNKNGIVVGSKHVAAINVRRMKEENRYGWLNKDNEIKVFKKGEIYAFKEYDSEQQIYGIPNWFGALKSILLGEQARSFPLKFFKNGGHTGGVLVTSGLTPDEKKKLRESIEGVKGDDNFKTLAAHFPSGEVDKLIKLLKFSDDTVKIDFTKFMAMAATDVMEAWGVRPELAGMMPEGAGGTGDLEKIERQYYRSDTLPYIRQILKINKILPKQNQLKFNSWKDIQENFLTLNT